MEFYNKSIQETPIRESVSRKVLAHKGELMIVEVYFHKASDDYGLQMRFLLHT